MNGHMKVTKSIQRYFLETMIIQILWDREFVL